MNALKSESMMSQLSKRFVVQNQLVKALSASVLGLMLNNAYGAYGDPFEGSGFVSGDWHVVCDNTLTCSAAGYTQETAEWRGSIMMTVAAGEKIPNTQVVLNYWESSNEIIAQIEGQNHPIELWLDDQYFGKVDLNTDEMGRGRLTTAQTKQLIDKARKHTKIVFKRGEYQWQISDKGMSAVLLKLDETQGRVGKPIALVSKQHSKQQIPKKAIAKPVIKKAFAYSDKDNQPISTSRLTYLQNNISKWVDIDAESLMGSEQVMGDCELVNPKTQVYQSRQEYSSSLLGWEFVPVDDSHTLAVHSCWTGAYNFGAGYWLIDHRKPSNPKLITTAGSDYYGGKIIAAHKGRGLGDCWSMTNWLWDGKTFAKTREMTTGLCRLIEAGGAWQMPTYVSEVIKPNQ
ncbi:DUF1176 domain-containing protein [Psychrobacter sp. DM8]|uniref:DUF1176 domain-containing protein n=1 Tax=Psychrobacter sp. DM8 TaxID=3440636 RepID=UPI003F50AD44